MVPTEDIAFEGEQLTTPYARPFKPVVGLATPIPVPVGYVQPATLQPGAAYVAAPAPMLTPQADPSQTYFTPSTAATVEPSNPDAMPLPAIGALVAAAPTIFEGVSKFLGNVFGGTPEDTSAAGFNSYLNATIVDRQAATFPSKEWMVAMAKREGWPSDDVAALQNTYYQPLGTAKKGDWNIAVVSLAPVTVKWFKGASETFQRASSAAFSDAPAVVQQQQPSVVKASNAAFGTTPQSQTATGSGASVQPTQLPAWAKPAAYIVGGVIALYLLGKFMVSMIRKR